MGIKKFIPDDPNTPNQNNTNVPPIIMGPLGMFSGAMPPNQTTDPTEDEVLELIVNYNETFKNKTPVMFRDEVIKQIISVLISKDKPNALLIGPAGTGKTAIVETLAGMLANNDIMIPPQIADYTIWELPVANIISGCSLQGELEERCKLIFDKFTEDPNTKGILFIDEIHQLLAHTREAKIISQMLKPYLARSELRIIGATTSQEANVLKDDPAFNRRFTRIIVDELTSDQTVEILKSVKQDYIQHYQNIDIKDSLLELVATTADQYRPAGSHRPDNALTLLDRTLSAAVVNRNAQMKKLQTSTNPND
jgi:ATP-dependent Clp protease ATP-binding subunit ClpA